MLHGADCAAVSLQELSADALRCDAGMVGCIAGAWFVAGKRAGLCSSAIMQASRCAVSNLGHAWGLMTRGAAQPRCWICIYIQPCWPSICSLPCCA